MVGELPEIRRRLQAHQTLETRHLPNGVRVKGPDTTVRALVAELLVSTPQIRYASQFRYAVAGLTADTLETYAGRPPVSEEAVARLGRSLADNMVRLDHELAPARTGRLVRIFTVAGRGSAHCTEISVGRHLAVVALSEENGAPDDPLDTARQADSAAAALSNRLREFYDQRPYDYGGWLAQAQQGQAPAEFDCAVAGRDVEPHVTATDAETAAACLRHIDCRRLHYAAVYRRGELVASVDVLHHPGVARLRNGRTAEESRRFYTGLGDRIDSFSHDLTMSAEPVIGAPIRHLVLDVETGAVYFHRVTHSTYLLGVTLDQDQVALAELEIAGLAAKLRSA